MLESVPVANRILGVMCSSATSPSSRHVIRLGQGRLEIVQEQTTVIEGESLERHLAGRREEMTRSIPPGGHGPTEPGVRRGSRARSRCVIVAEHDVVRHTLGVGVNAQRREGEGLVVGVEVGLGEIMGCGT